MIKVLLILPILIPQITGALCLLFSRAKNTRRWISLIGSTALLVSAIVLFKFVLENGIQATQMGNWPAPFGITLVADLLSAVLILVTAIIGLTVSVYSIVDINIERQNFGFFTLFQILIMGVCGAFLTGDMFNLYVWFEVLLMASFALMALGGDKRQVEGAVKYVLLSLMSSLFFLAGIGILYGVTGTLNMADLAIKLNTSVPPEFVTTISLLFLISFGLKGALFPLFFWLPASYPTPPVAVSAVFAGLLTKVGVYAIIRTFTLLFVAETHFTHNLILVIAGLTMITGVLGAASQSEIRKILSFHIISQIGYMIMGLALFTPLAIAGAVFYIIHHIIVKTNLFLISGIIFRISGSFELKKLGGLYKFFPFLSLLFLIPALSLAGIPPLSGFWAKFILIKAGLEEGRYVIVATALLVGILTLFSMTKIWMNAFWKQHPEHETKPLLPIPSVRKRLLYYLPVTALACITISIGFLADEIFIISQRAADQLLNPSEYISAVFGSAQP